MNPQEPVATVSAVADQITIERTCVNKGRMAPAGSAFFIATYLDKTKEKTVKKKMTQLVNTKGMTEKEEEDLKDNLKSELIKHFKL